MAQHSLNFPATAPNRKCTSSPLSLWWSGDGRGGGVRLSIALCTYERKEEQNGQERSEWKHKSAVNIHAVWGLSLGTEEVYCSAPKPSGAILEFIAIWTKTAKQIKMAQAGEMLVSAYAYFAFNIELKINVVQFNYTCIIFPNICV